MQYSVKVWSRDWENFDWSSIQKKLEETKRDNCDERDIGLSQEELLEYFEWMKINDSMRFRQLQLVELLVSQGIPEEPAIYYAEHPDKLKDDLGDL